MASTCPNCGKKLHIWDIKAECSECGVSIPNFNWEARLEEDNINAEKQFAKFNKTFNRVAYSIWGTKLRIVRLILTVLPAIGFILPWASLKSDISSFELTVISLSGKKALIDFFQSFFGNSGLFISNMRFEGNAGPVTLGVVGYLLFVLSALLIVIAFFMNIIMCKRPKTKVTVVFDILSVIASIASVTCFVMAGNVAKDAVAFNFGEFSMLNATSSISWGYFVALFLLLVATGVNIAVAKAPAKSDEVLEEERLARKAAKDEAEKKKAEEKKKAKEEEAKKVEEEQKRIVAEAKAKLEESMNKKK